MDLVAFGTVVLFQFNGEILILLMVVGIDIEDHQVLFTPVRKRHGLSFEIEHFDVRYLSRQGRLLGLSRYGAECQRKGCQRQKIFQCHHNPMNL